MNERIRELWEYCLVEHNYGSDAEYYKKFAQIVIKECANIAYEYDLPKMSGPGMIIGGRIEQHFGVDE